MGLSALVKRLIFWFRGQRITMRAAILTATVTIVTTLCIVASEVFSPILDRILPTKPIILVMPTEHDLQLAAEQIRLCMERHRLSRQRYIGLEEIDLPGSVLDLEPGDLLSRKEIEYCEWPPSSYSAADGYVEIVVETVVGPGRGEATFASYVDRIYSQCSRLKLDYMFGKQGLSGHHSFETDAGSIVDAHGDEWDCSTIDENPDQYYLPWLGFYTQKGEVVVIKNAAYELEDASCIP